MFQPAKRAGWFNLRLVAGALAVIEMPVISENFKMRPKHNWYSKMIRKYYKIRVNLAKPRRPIPDKEIARIVENKGELVIQNPFGGLGDHLTYSFLPELLWKQKHIRTYVSDKSIFDSKAIRDFVWGLNPYVTYTKEKGWFTYKPLPNNFPTMDEYFQKLFNLRGNGCPKIYYRPDSIDQLKGKIIVDPSFGPSGKANGYFQPDFHKKFVEYLRNNVEGFVLIVHKHSKKKNVLEEQIKKVFDPDCYEVRTIEELGDVLFSAKQRYLLYSGAASLSAAMGLPSIVLCNRRAVPNFQYPVNTYVDLTDGD